jgi:hypothetical protein
VIETATTLRGQVTDPLISDPLYSVKDSCALLGGISPWTLRGWIAQGKVVGVRVGRRRMLRLSEIRRLVREDR